MKNKIAEYAGYSIHILTFIAYFILLFTLYVPPSLLFLKYFGFFLFGLGILFVVLSLIGQRQRIAGKILKRGVYGIVRHPMYLGGMLLFIAMACFLPHWIMLALSLVNLVIIYAFAVSEERMNMATFGDKYQKYMSLVPRFNLILGLIRTLKRNKSVK